MVVFAQKIEFTLNLQKRTRGSIPNDFCYEAF